ncbi:MAG: 1-acyl-sn-glycerol-3-phosphate acyltransferase, partial [Thiobacillus sp.]
MALASPPSLPRRWLHRLHEYAALWFGLGLLGTTTLTWSLLAVPLSHVLPKRWAEPHGRWAITTVFRIDLAALALIGACRFDLSALDVLRDEGPLIVAPN